MSENKKAEFKPGDVVKIARGAKSWHGSTSIGAGKTGQVVGPSSISEGFLHIGALPEDDQWLNAIVKPEDLTLVEVVKEEKPTFEPGDMVRISDAPFYRQWGDTVRFEGEELEKYAGSVGTVSRGPDTDGDYQVEDLEDWGVYLAPECLTLIEEDEFEDMIAEPLRTGDRVKVRGWSDRTRHLDGKKGTIVRECGVPECLVVRLDEDQDEWHFGLDRLTSIVEVNLTPVKPAPVFKKGDKVLVADQLTKTGASMSVTPRILAMEGTVTDVKTGWENHPEVTQPTYKVEVDGNLWGWNIPEDMLSLAKGDSRLEAARARLAEAIQSLEKPEPFKLQVPAGSSGVAGAGTLIELMDQGVITSDEAREYLRGLDINAGALVPLLDRGIITDAQVREYLGFDNEG